MKVVFNTGRLYQTDGQVITSILNKDHILFMDHSRGIAGRIEILDPERITTEDLLIRFTMREYDAGRYRMSMDAMQLTRDPRVKPLPWRL